MPRNITVTFEDGSTHVYQNAPDTITPEIVQKRAEAQFGKGVTGIDGGGKTEPQDDSLIASMGRGLAQQGRALRNVFNTVAEPAATIATGLASLPVAAVGTVGKAVIDQELPKNYFQNLVGSMTYSPRTEEGQEGLSAFVKAFEESKLAGLPVAGTGLSRAIAMAPKDAQMFAAKSAAVANKTGEKFARGAEKLMVHALKPSPSQVISGDAQIAARELLARGINPNTAGVVEIQRLIDDLGAQVKASIGASKGTVSQQEVLAAVQRVRDKFANQVDPTADLASIAGVANRFAEHPSITSDAIPVQQAQALKQGTYNVLRGKYGEVGSAETEAQKALASGLRAGIEKVAPEVMPLNAEQSALIDTLNVVERRAALDLAKDPAQLTGMLRSPGAWAAFTANKSSAFKAFVAQRINQAANALKLETKGSRFSVPAAPAVQVPTNNAVTLFGRTGEYIPAGQYTPDWMPPRSVAPDVRAEMPNAPPMLQDLGENASLMQQARQYPEQVARERAARMAQEQAIAAQEAAKRRPASGGTLFDFDPMTGRLKPVDQGLKGATPDVMQNYGNVLSDAVEKISSGRQFAMSAEERIAWNGRKVDLVESVPQLRGLTDKQVAERMMDRQWVADTVKKMKEKAAGFAEIERRAGNMQAVQEARMQREKLLDMAEQLDEQLRMQSSSVKLGQGPKTRAAQRETLFGVRP